MLWIRELSEAAKNKKQKTKEELLQKLAEAHKNFEALQKEAQLSSKGQVPRRLSAGNPGEAYAREQKFQSNWFYLSTLNKLLSFILLPFFLFALNPKTKSADSSHGLLHFLQETKNGREDQLW